MLACCPSELRRRFEKKNYNFSCLARSIVRPWRWRQYVSWTHMWNSTALHCPVTHRIATDWNNYCVNFRILIRCFITLISRSKDLQRKQRGLINYWISKYINDIYVDCGFVFGQSGVWYSAVRRFTVREHHDLCSFALPSTLYWLKLQKLLILSIRCRLLFTFHYQSLYGHYVLAHNPASWYPFSLARAHAHTETHNKDFVDNVNTTCQFMNSLK
jgi:hypothetical protein